MFIPIGVRSSFRIKTNFSVPRLTWIPQMSTLLDIASYCLPSISNMLLFKALFVCMWVFSHVRLFVTPWTVVYQAPLSIAFVREEYWSELPFPPPGDLPNPGIKPTSLASPALAGGFFTTAPPQKPKASIASCLNEHPRAMIFVTRSQIVFFLI